MRLCKIDPWWPLKGPRDVGAMGAERLRADGIRVV
jgi:hypothetical protein